MAIIITFPRKALRPSEPSAGQAAAEILMFTGVRYERLAESEICLSRTKAPGKPGLPPRSKSA